MVYTLWVHLSGGCTGKHHDFLEKFPLLVFTNCYFLTLSERQGKNLESQHPSIRPLCGVSRFQENYSQIFLESYFGSVFSYCVALNIHFDFDFPNMFISYHLSSFETVV